MTGNQVIIRVEEDMIKAEQVVGVALLVQVDRDQVRPRKVIIQDQEKVDQMEPCSPPRPLDHLAEQGRCQAKVRLPTSVSVDRLVRRKDREDRDWLPCQSDLRISLTRGLQ